MDAIAQFIPFLLIVVLQAAIAWPMTKRKGLSVGYFILCSVPLIGPVALLWVASKTDQSILDRLARLEASDTDKGA